MNKKEQELIDVGIEFNIKKNKIIRQQTKDIIER